MSCKLTCFKAYDIRGKLGEELNPNIAYRIGRAFGEYEQAKSVVIGGDIRLSSDELKNALAEGLMEAGTDVIDIGVTGTEEVYFATQYLGVDGGIEVTASHNPKDYNGMKIVRKGAKPVSGESGLKQIQSLAEKNEFASSPRRGQLTKQSNLDSYVDHLMSYVSPGNFKPMKIVVNAGNGAAGHVIDEVERRFNELSIPLSFIKIHHNPDGSFPNGIPNPLLPECRSDTSDAVKLHQADLGIAWDGDFDRCFFFDENGDFIEGYYIVGLLAEAFLQKEAGAKIIHDPRLMWNTIDIAENNGGIPVMSKTGHAFIKERMRKEDAIYGGEMSAHHYFRDFSYCDSGMIPWLLISELLCLKQKTLSESVKERVSLYPVSGEINVKTEDAEQVISEIKEKYMSSAISVDYTDGLSLSFDDWRFNVRLSNTEPLVRLNVESRSDIALMQEKTKQILAILKK